MILDIIAACLIALGFYLGYNRGLIKTVFDTLSLFIGILAALKLSPIIINLLQGLFNMSPAITFILGIVITFIGVMALIRFIGRKLEDVLEAANINVLNKIAGGGLQALFFAVLLSYVLYLGSNIGVITEKVKTESMTYNKLETLPAYTKSGLEKMKPIFSGFWSKTVEAMDSIKGKAEGEEAQDSLQ
jgi:membrane protein required for colicin V production